MGDKSGTLVMVIVVLLIAMNIVGLCIPVWYNKLHQHNIFNETKEQSTCVIHVNIREGLWQRYCLESRVEDCELDVQEWCDNLDFPEYNDFVVASEIVGDLILVFVFCTVLRSKCRQKPYNVEMVGAETGLGGILMMVGVLVYAAADTGEIGYQATDLHVGWSLCVSSGGISVLLCLFCMCKHIKSIPRIPVGYFPINNDDVDDELIIDL
ncbi:hypothetical protein ACF0H5_018074 [Mactra antiquata]